MKKILSFLLAAVMMAALLVGCGQQQTDAPGNDVPDQKLLSGVAGAERPHSGRQPCVERRAGYGVSLPDTDEVSIFYIIAL